ncbi:hypothetical protein D6825_02360 [Candidatus Woesearchaeota archaeon]|nr:MAG: hypothetical protein D6825_02360 [Candidatus Woesearchaeota archaeon]
MEYEQNPGIYTLKLEKLDWLTAQLLKREGPGFAKFKNHTSSEIESIIEEMRESKPYRKLLSAKNTWFCNLTRNTEKLNKKAKINDVTLAELAQKHKGFRLAMCADRIALLQYLTDEKYFSDPWQYRVTQPVRDLLEFNGTLERQIQDLDRKQRERPNSYNEQQKRTQEEYRKLQQETIKIIKDKMHAEEILCAQGIRDLKNAKGIPMIRNYNDLAKYEENISKEILKQRDNAVREYAQRLIKSFREYEPEEIPMPEDIFEWSAEEKK